MNMPDAWTLLSPSLSRYIARFIRFIKDSVTFPLFPYIMSSPVVHVFAANHLPAAGFIKHARLHGKAAGASHQTHQKAGPAVHMLEEDPSLHIQGFSDSNCGITHEM